MLSCTRKFIFAESKFKKWVSTIKVSIFTYVEDELLYFAERKRPMPISGGIDHKTGEGTQTRLKNILGLKQIKYARPFSAVSFSQ